MNPIKAVKLSKRFVVRHKVAIAVVATSAFWIYLNNASLQQHNEFLKEHDLFDAFYTPEEIEL